MFKAVISS